MLSASSERAGLLSRRPYIYIFFCLRHPPGTQVPGNTTPCPLQNNGTTYVSPPRKSRHPNRNPTRRPTQAQTQATNRQAGSEAGQAKKSRHPNRNPTRRPTQEQTQATNGQAGSEAGRARKEEGGGGWRQQLHPEVLQSSSREAGQRPPVGAPPDGGAWGLQFPMGPGCAPASRFMPMGPMYICIYIYI